MNASPLNVWSKFQGFFDSFIHAKKIILTELEQSEEFHSTYLNIWFYCIVQVYHVIFK